MSAPRKTPVRIQQQYADEPTSPDTGGQEEIVIDDSEDSNYSIFDSDSEESPVSSPEIARGTDSESSARETGEESPEDSEDSEKSNESSESAYDYFMCQGKMQTGRPCRNKVWHSGEGVVLCGLHKKQEAGKSKQQKVAKKIATKRTATRVTQKPRGRKRRETTDSSSQSSSSQKSSPASASLGGLFVSPPAERTYTTRGGWSTRSTRYGP